MVKNSENLYGILINESSEDMNEYKYIFSFDSIKFIKDIVAISNRLI